MRLPIPDLMRLKGFVNGARWLPILYRDFYDIPRIFVVEHAGELILFDCPFDDRADEYPDHYTVLRLDPSARAMLDGSWVDLPAHGMAIGRVPTADVEFDHTRRAAINARILNHVA